MVHVMTIWGDLYRAQNTRVCVLDWSLSTGTALEALFEMEGLRPLYHDEALEMPSDGPFSFLDYDMDRLLVVPVSDERELYWIGIGHSTIKPDLTAPDWREVLEPHFVRVRTI